MYILTGTQHLSLTSVVMVVYMILMVHRAAESFPSLHGQPILSLFPPGFCSLLDHAKASTAFRFAGIWDGANIAVATKSSCPLMMCSHAPVAVCQIRAVLSLDDVMIRAPSVEKLAEFTGAS